ncbi:GNAT family N-acetyltransferase [Bradyrhizobium sp. CB3481]|uniref:GNAT family N-acetyltransferase n=1 Tax=Bradyrhizobium sp. CB3481 TaxID=3039158 RepID=UPI0024B06971|nr:GNAT family N-acetyltransferase [Bradyrhizobium sp. CB3481]WFU14452.1 GNAT family N-acetyltransferase [Bradyrhizobium sp. CB3481]
MKIDRAFLARLRIEPLDRNLHDRAAFSSGVVRVDNFLKNNSGSQQDNDLTRVSVACLDDQIEVVGYYALNSHAIDITTLPEPIRKKLPRYPTIPAIYLSMIGFSDKYRGRGGGSHLLADALKNCVRVADIAGSHMVVLDALNERAAKLYRLFGFVDLPNHAPRMTVSMKVLRAAVAQAEAEAAAEATAAASTERTGT